MITASTMSLFLSLSESAHAEGDSYYCGKSRKDGQVVPSTYVQTADGQKKLVMQWTNKAFSASGWTPQKRCAVVSRRFQSNYERGMLKYLSSSSIRGLEVICAANESGKPCNRENLLFTLKKGTRASEVMQELMDRVAYGSGHIPSQSDDSFDLNFEDYINNVSVETEEEPE
jgi:Circadian oscillating protein COP23